jgi:hypothetical protein
MATPILSAFGKQYYASGYYCLPGPDFPPQHVHQCSYSGCNVGWCLAQVYDDTVHNWSFLCPMHCHMQEPSDIENSIAHAIQVDVDTYVVCVEGTDPEVVKLTPDTNITEYVQSRLAEEFEL